MAQSHRRALLCTAAAAFTRPCASKCLSTTVAFTTTHILSDDQTTVLFHRNKRKQRVCFLPVAAHSIRGGDARSTTSTDYCRRLYSSSDSSSNPEEQSTKRTDSQLITYITDVEGDADYLNRYVGQSRVLKWKSIQPRWHKDEQQQQPASDFPEHFSSCRYFPYDHCMDFQDSNGILIYGGDTTDKGGFDLYVLRQLLDLKRRYPDRCHFIMGNRDINKMRISQEMGLVDNNSNADPELPHHEGVYWLRNANAAAGGDPTDPSLYPPADNASERLKWMLARTMGSPQAFELRRQELLDEQQRAASVFGSNPQRDTTSSTTSNVVTDEDVVRSYRESCHPSTGEIGNYLANAHLAYQLGQVLIIHGALPLTKDILKQSLEDGNADEFWKDMSFARPWTSPTISSKSSSNTTAEEAIQTWLSDLDKWVKNALQAWRDHYANGSPASDTIWALKGGYPEEMPFGQLMQYGMGWTADGKRNPTVVYSSWSIDGLPQHFYPDNHKPEDQLFVKLTRDFFRHTGLRLILAGHQPQGDFPTPIRVSDDNGNSCLVLCCDTSYSGDTGWINPPQTAASEVRSNPGRGSGPGFRGDLAVSETLVELCNQTGQVLDIRCHGVLCDGTSYESQSLAVGDTDCHTKVVGKLAQGSDVPPPEDTPHHTRWWTKALFKGQDACLLTTAKGYDVHNLITRVPEI